MRFNSPRVLEKLTIIAPGLLGASIGMAAKERSLAHRISVWARKEETRESLASAQWCDESPEAIKDACSGSSLITLCAPVERIIELAERIAPGLDSNPVVTDVGSVKSKLSRHCSAALKGRARFIGSHPMAGSEKSGMDNASADLFEDRTCFITPLEDSEPDAKDTVISFWQDLGCHVLQERPEKHDSIVANVSHLPHLLASTLASYLSTALPESGQFCGNGLKDTTRIASGDPQMWRDIVIQNRPEIIRAIGAFQDELQLFKANIANEEDFAVLQALADGKAFRDELDAKHPQE